MRLTPYEMLDYLKARGSRIGGVTSGEKGLLWYDESGLVRLLTALPVPMHRILDTSGAGDVFHGNDFEATALYLVHLITRNSFGLMTRKLSVTESQRSAQFRGTFSRRKLSVASANWAHVA